MAKKLFDKERVEQTARFIAAELTTLLDRRYDSHISKRLQEACPTYDTLTNGENLLATVRALSVVQLQIIAELSAMNSGGDGDFEDAEPDAEPPAHFFGTSDELMKRLGLKPAP
jgi:hypothetical protein